MRRWTQGWPSAEVRIGTRSIFRIPAASPAIRRCLQHCPTFSTLTLLLHFPWSPSILQSRLVQPLALTPCCTLSAIQATVFWFRHPTGVRLITWQALACSEHELTTVPDGFDFHFRVRASARPIPVNVSTLDETLSAALLPALEKAWNDADCPVRGLLLTNPHNPLGLCYPSSVLEECVQFCHENQFTSFLMRSMRSHLSHVTHNLHPSPPLSVPHLPSMSVLWVAIYRAYIQSGVPAKILVQADYVWYVPRSSD